MSGKDEGGCRGIGCEFRRTHISNWITHEEPDKNDIPQINGTRMHYEYKRNDKNIIIKINEKEVVVEKQNIFTPPIHYILYIYLYMFVYTNMGNIYIGTWS